MQKYLKIEGKQINGRLIIMKSSTKTREIKIERVRELGDIVSILLDRKTDVIDLPLSHLATLSDAESHAKRYGEVLEAETSDNQAIFIGPFGAYKSINELRLAYLLNPSIQSSVQRRYMRHREEDLEFT